METSARTLEVKDYVRIFTKRWLLILIITAAVGMMATLLALRDPRYRAEALVLIRTEPIQRLQFAEGQAIESSDVQTELTLDTHARIATSYNVAARTAAKLAARESGQKLEVDPSEIITSLHVHPQEPDRLVITATSPERDKAREFANETAETFVTISAELRRKDVTAAREFLEEQIGSIQARLETLEEELASYQHQVGIVVPDVEANAAMAELKSYERELNSAITQLDTLTSRQAELRRQLNREPALLEIPGHEPHPERAVLEAQLRQERLTLTGLQARYQDEHPAVSEAKRRIDTLQARINDLPETREITQLQTNPRRPVLAAELDNATVNIAETRSRISRLQAIVGKVRGDTADLPLELATIDRLQSQINLARNTYETFLVQLEQSKLREAIKQGSATVIDRAVEVEELRAKLGRTFVFGIALGLFVGLAAALLLEALDDTFHSPEDLAYYTDVPFLGMVPMLDQPSDQLVTIVAPKSPPAEAYRVLRSNIHFAQADNPARTFLVTSAGAGEGKSMTTANLAVVFAQSGQKVLLIDADLRRPTMQRRFKVSRDTGLTNLLIGEMSLEEVTIEVEQVPGLYIMPTGPLPPNPADLLGSDRMVEIVAEATRFADIVILDSPPAIVLTDAVVLSSKVDRTILIAECDHVNRTAFIEMIRLIRNARGNILGAILNKMRLSTADYYYYYYYYDYAKETPISRPLNGTPKPREEGEQEAALEVLDEPMRPAPSAEEVFGPDIEPADDGRDIFGELYGDTPPQPPTAPPTPLQIDDVQVEEPPPEEKKKKPEGNGTRRNGHSNGHRNGNANNGGSLLDDLLGPDLDDF